MDKVEFTRKLMNEARPEADRHEDSLKILRRIANQRDRLDDLHRDFAKKKSITDDASLKRAHRFLVQANAQLSKALNS